MPAGGASRKVTAMGLRTSRKGSTKRASSDCQGDERVIRSPPGNFKRDSITARHSSAKTGARVPKRAAPRETAFFHGFRMFSLALRTDTLYSVARARPGTRPGPATDSHRNNGTKHFRTIE